MADVTLQVLKQEPTGVIYADPAQPDTTCRFRTTTSPKTLNGVNVTNYRFELIYNDSVTVEVASGVFAKEPVSVRISTSGSPLVSTRINEFLESFKAQVSTWVTQNCHKGFVPSTAPIIKDLV